MHEALGNTFAARAFSSAKNRYCIVINRGNDETIFFVGTFQVTTELSFNYFQSLERELMAQGVHMTDAIVESAFCHMMRRSSDARHASSDTTIPPLNIHALQGIAEMPRALAHEPSLHDATEGSTARRSIARISSEVSTVGGSAPSSVFLACMPSGRGASSIMSVQELAISQKTRAK